MTDHEPNRLAIVCVAIVVIGTTLFLLMGASQ
jgi:cytochrome c-type biogenesis protein CcmE